MEDRIKRVRKNRIERVKETLAEAKASGKEDAVKRITKRLAKLEEEPIVEVKE